MNEMFTDVSCFHSEDFTFSYCINWNVEAITGCKRANGYIVQHFSRTSVPRNFLIDDEDYFEAWKIENGINLDSGRVCDDEFAVSTNDGMGSLRTAMDTQGKYTITADVYWIPAESPLYVIVDGWSKQGVANANGLKSSKVFNELTREYLAFSRPVFEHAWSLSGLDEIESKIQSAIFRYCPNDYDEELVTTTLDFIFDGKPQPYLTVKNNIIAKWKRQWVK